MASLVASRRVPVSTLLLKLVNFSPIRTVSAASPSMSRSFNTNVQVTNLNDEDRSVDVQRRPGRSVSRRSDFSPGFFSDVFDPFSPTRSRSQVLNLMDHHFLSSPGVSSRKGWDVREDDNALPHVPTSLTLHINTFGGSMNRSVEFNLRHGATDQFAEHPWQLEGPKGTYEAKKVEAGLFFEGRHAWNQ